MIKVLLVDDHPMIGAALEMLLRDSEYEFLGRARSVSEANSKLAKLKPDLVLLDVNLPDGSGLDILRKVGEPVAAGEPLYRIHGSEPSDFGFAVEAANEDSGVRVAP